MSIFGSTKKAAMFATVKVPLAIIGWKTIAANNEYIVNSFKALNAPTCPECLRGGMHCKTPEFEVRDEVDGKQLNTIYPWHCSNLACGYELFAPKDPTAAKALIAKQMAARGRERLAEFGKDDIAKLIGQHKLKSRLLWLAGIALFAMFVYRLADGQRIDLCIGNLCIGFVAALYGLIGSYRAWQLETGTIFIEGAFKRFVINENWIR
ncbi:MAG TPA: hypothetical protein PLM85_08935 [Nitrosomonas sp.]|nr:hypothetical protein [Nitrosomonas sp.]